MYAALRRAAASALPLAARRIVTSSSSRTFHSALTVRFLLHSEIAPSAGPSLRFANSFATETSADDNLIQLLESGINCALELFHARGRNQIEDNPGDRTIQLKRQYHDETIKVQVDIPGENEDDNEVENEDDIDSFVLGESSIHLVVSVFKGNGVWLEFGVTAFDEVLIDSLSIKQPEVSKEQPAYEGPKFTDLDENLQKAFHKFLEIRGINPRVTNFLQDYMFSKVKEGMVEIPFEVEDNPGGRTFQLKRQYNDETIKVQFDLHDIIEESDKRRLHPFFILSERVPLVVSVFKGNGVCLEFRRNAYPAKVSIDSLSIKQPDESKDQLAYEEPKFTYLDENLQKAFHKYLKIRGIKPTIGRFFHQHRYRKIDKARVAWLKDLKNFIEK